MSRPGTSDTPAASAGDRLDSWKEIAAYLNKGVRTVQRWETEEGLPVYRLPHKSRSTVYAVKSELDEWWDKRGERLKDVKDQASDTRWLALPVSVAILILLAFCLGLWWLWHGDPPAQAVSFNERDWIIVSDFDNQTGARSLDGFVEYALKHGLSSSRFVNVVPQPRISDALRLMGREADSRLDPDTSREICLIDGQIKLMVTGQIDKTPDGYRVKARLVDPQTQTIVAERLGDAVENQLRSEVQKLAEWVRAVLGERPIQADSEAFELEKATPISNPWLSLLTHANRAFEAGDYEAARGLLIEVIGKDPRLAVAHFQLSRVLLQQGQPEALLHAKTAVDLSDSLPQRERLLIRGSYLQLARDYDQAEQHLKAFVKLYSDDYWGLFLLAETLQMQDRAQEALQYIVRLAELRPNDFGSNARALWHLAYSDRLSEGEAILARARQLATPDLQALYPEDLAWLQLLQPYQAWRGGDVASAIGEAEKLRQQLGLTEEPLRYRLAYGLGFFYAGVGKLKAARDVFLSTPGCLEHVADLHFLADDRESLKKSLLGDGEFENLRQPARRAMLFARAGLTDRARAVQQNLSSNRSENPGDRGPRRLEGEVLLAEGKVDEAIAALRAGRGFLLDIPSFFLASESLARALKSKGRLEQANGVLKFAAARRNCWVYPASVPFWIRIQDQLARTYREMGLEKEAADIDQELTKLLAFADVDHPVVQRLKRSKP